MSLFTARKKDAVAAWGERQLITLIRSWLGNTTPSSPFGIGDDCAVIPLQAKTQLITVDPIIFGRHFTAEARARAVGAKLLKRNLSDIAAMGGVPTVAVIALSLSADVSTTWLKEFYQGIATEARRYRVSIVGGDVSQLDTGFVASLTLLGRASGTRILTRHGAKVGDALYVTGRLGGSIQGHHFSFQPRLAEGAWLAERAEVRSLMDLSDGLAKDIYELAPPKGRPAIEADRVPISAAAYSLAKASGRSALEHALTDGEDYELVFAVRKAAQLPAFETAWKRRFKTRLTRIGFVVPANQPVGEEVRLERLQGYEHLR